MTTLRLIGDAIELDGRPVATLAPNVTPSQREDLITAFDDIYGLEMAELLIVRDRLHRAEQALGQARADAERWQSEAETYRAILGV